MSFFKRMFASKKVEPPTTLDAIQKLRDQEDLLIRKQDYLEKKVAEEIALAKHHGTKNKRLALQALTRKKQHEKQLQHINGALQTIDFQRNALENASMNAEVLKAMGGASKALKFAQNSMDVDKVHELMDDIAEQQEVAKEISDAISNPVALDRDQSDLLAELEALEQEELDKQLLDIGMPIIDLPEAPANEITQTTHAKPVAAKAEREKELEDLESWANT